MVDLDLSRPSIEAKTARPGWWLVVAAHGGAAFSLGGVYLTMRAPALVLLLGRAALGQQGEEGSCDWAAFGTGSADVNAACCSEADEACDGGMPRACTADCARVYMPFHRRCADFMGAQMPTQVAMFNAIRAECQATLNKEEASGVLETCTDGACAARHVNDLERRLANMPVPWWQGDGSLYIGNQQTSLQFAPCRPVFLYDAGVTEQPIDCLNGLRGTSEIELEPDHDYPLTPMFGCPANPTSNPGGGWSEQAPTNGEHYFSNVLSGDIGGWNSWGIDDNTGDGGQFQTFQKTLNPARVKEAFEVGWVMRARARLMSCTTVSAYLFAFQGATNGGADGSFRYLP